jgi:hypothetical protein
MKRAPCIDKIPSLPRKEEGNVTPFLLKNVMGRILLI